MLFKYNSFHACVWTPLRQPAAFAIVVVTKTRMEKVKTPLQLPNAASRWKEVRGIFSDECPKHATGRGSFHRPPFTSPLPTATPATRRRTLFPGGEGARKIARTIYSMRMGSGAQRT